MQVAQVLGMVAQQVPEPTGPDAPAEVVALVTKGLNLIWFAVLAGAFATASWGLGSLAWAAKRQQFGGVLRDLNVLRFVNSHRLATVGLAAAAVVLLTTMAGGFDRDSTATPSTTSQLAVSSMTPSTTFAPSQDVSVALSCRVRVAVCCGVGGCSRHPPSASFAGVRFPPDVVLLAMR